MGVSVEIHAQLVKPEIQIRKIVNSHEFSKGLNVHSKFFTAIHISTHAIEDFSVFRCCCIA